jgi:hypothetical protein
MVNCTLFLSKEEVFKRLEAFLHERNYRNIRSEKEKLMISAERRDTFFGKKYAIRFEVKEKSDAVTDIVITVNPQHSVPSAPDTEKENKIRSRIYFYF